MAPQSRNRDCLSGFLHLCDQRIMSSAAAFATRWIPRSSFLNTLALRRFRVFHSIAMATLDRTLLCRFPSQMSPRLAGLTSQRLLRPFQSGSSWVQHRRRWAMLSVAQQKGHSSELAIDVRSRLSLVYTQSSLASQRNILHLFGAKFFHMAVARGSGGAFCQITL